MTNAVKEDRGHRCQLCGYPGFRKSNGRQYCEVHHLFHLAKKPPAECLTSGYVVVLCATCHRRMHYASVGDPKRSESGWTVNVDNVDVYFDTGLVDG